MLSEGFQMDVKVSFWSCYVIARIRTVKTFDTFSHQYIFLDDHPCSIWNNSSCHTCCTSCWMIWFPPSMPSGFIETLLDICLALFLHLVRGHFLRFHYSNPLWSNYSTKYIFTQRCVLFVPQVEDSRSNCVFVSGICWFVVAENWIFNQLCQFFWCFYCTVREITSTWNV